MQKQQQQSADLGKLTRAYQRARARTTAARTALNAANAAYDAANDGHAIRFGSPARTAAAAKLEQALDAFTATAAAEHAAYDKLMEYWNVRS